MKKTRFTEERATSRGLRRDSLRVSVCSRLGTSAAKRPDLAEAPCRNSCRGVRLRRDSLRLSVGSLFVTSAAKRPDLAEARRRRAKAGWEAGNLQEPFASSCDCSPALANSCEFLRLARDRFCGHLPPFAPVCCLFRNDVTHDVTRMECLSFNSH
jgi:hypothetical protein